MFGVQHPEPLDAVQVTLCPQLSVRIEPQIAPAHVVVIASGVQQPPPAVHVTLWPQLLVRVEPHPSSTPHILSAQSVVHVQPLPCRHAAPQPSLAPHGLPVHDGTQSHVSPLAGHA